MLLLLRIEIDANARARWRQWLSMQNLVTCIEGGMFGSILK